MEEQYNPYTYNPYVQKEPQADSQADPQTEPETWKESASQNSEQMRQENPYTYGTGQGYYGERREPENRGTRGRENRPAKGSFGGKLAKTAAIALVFGLVSGSVFTGVSYAGHKLLGISGEDAAQTGPGSNFTELVPNQHQMNTAVGFAADLTDVSSIVEEVEPSIVAITNISTVTYHSFWGQNQSYQAESCGSGIIVSRDEEYLYIATNNHVVAQAEELSVKFVDESIVAAETRGSYPSGDLAVVMVKLSDIEADTLAQIKVATIGDSTALKVGEPTIAIGNALGYGQSVTTGIVSALDRSVTTQDSNTGAKITNGNLIQTDAAINPGNSGGALLNRNGEVIGINSVKYSDTSVEGIGYAIPMETALPIINSLIQDGKYVDTQTAYLGIGGADVTADIAETYHMPQGVYINTVYKGSGAAAAGLLEGDIITQIGDTEITCMDELKEALTSYSAGDTVKIVVYRQSNQGYKGYYVDVTLSSAEVLENQ